MDNAGFDAFSIEDTHRRNDSALFQAFKKTKVIQTSLHKQTESSLVEHNENSYQYAIFVRGVCSMNVEAEGRGGARDGL